MVDDKLVSRYGGFQLELILVVMWRPDLEQGLLKLHLILIVGDDVRSV